MLGRISRREGEDDYLHLLVKSLRTQGVYISSFSSAGVLKVPLKMVLLRLKGYKILHFHWNVFPSPLKMTLFLRLAKLLGYKIIWTVHSLYPPGSDVEISRGLDMESSFRLLYTICSMVVCSSEATKKKLSETYGFEKPILICPIVHGPYEVYLNQSEEPSLDIPQDSGKVFVHLGVLRPQTKNIEELVTAFRKLNRIHPNTYLIIAGPTLQRDREFGEYLKRLCENNTHTKLFIRTINHGEIHKFLEVADYVVLPYTKSYGYSGALTLAITFDKPVIASNVGAIGEIVSKYGLGIVYTTSLLEGLERACNISPELYAHFLEKIKVLRLNRSWDNVASETKRTYESVLNML